MSRRYEQVDEYAPGNEDYEYDSWRQRLLDAHTEGRMAGQKGLSAEMNPYFAFEPEYNQWHHGRLEGLAQQPTRKVA